MKLVRLISTLLFYVTRCLSLMYAMIAAYAILALLLYHIAPVAPMIAGEGRFEIYYPFTSAPFLRGDYNPIYIAEMVGGVTLYTLFFWLLGDIFRTFRHSPLFTVKGVARLNRFYAFSMIVPVLVLLLMALFSVSEPAAQVIGILHIIIGIFAYFMAAIFKQGLELQVQQEFTI